MLNKNSFSIINTSYVRKHGISPKNMNIHEYKFLLHSYKALFYLTQNEFQPAAQEIKNASDINDKYNVDPVKVKTQINVFATSQHLSMLASLKSFQFLKENNLAKSV